MAFFTGWSDPLLEFLYTSGLRPQVFPDRPTDTSTHGYHWDIPVLEHKVSSHAQVPWLRRAGIQFTALHCYPVLPSPSVHKIGTPEFGDFKSSIAGLRFPLSTASPIASRLYTHNSGPWWCSLPFTCGSFIPSSMPVHPGGSNRPLCSTPLPSFVPRCENLKISSPLCWH